MPSFVRKRRGLTVRPGKGARFPPRKADKPQMRTSGFLYGLFPQLAGQPLTTDKETTWLL